MGAFLAAVLAVSSLPVPFVPQEKDGCGAAALAMVLGYWEVPADHRAIAQELREPELRGIRGSRLAAFAEGLGLVAIPYAGDLDNLREYVAKERPLIVAWNMGKDRFHNVVVVGLDDAQAEVVVHDPARGAFRRVPRETFLKRWAGAGHWTLVVVPKGPGGRGAGSARPRYLGVSGPAVPLALAATACARHPRRVGAKRAAGASQEAP